MDLESQALVPSRPTVIGQYPVPQRYPLGKRDFLTLAAGPLLGIGVGNFGYKYVAPAMYRMFPKRFKYNENAGIVTRQNDVVQNRSKFKRRSKKARFVSKIRRIRFRRFKRSVKRAIYSPKFRILFFQNASRSFKSIFNQQAVVVIPVFSYRGSPSTSASVPLGSGGAGQFVFRSDQANLVTDYIKNTVLYNDDATAVASQKSWWWKHGGTSLDITMTNTGSDSTSDGTNRNVEYDMYVVWANKRMPQFNSDYEMNHPIDWVNYQGSKEQDRANTSLLADSGILEASWTPYTNKLNKIGISSRKMASGYIDQSESVRLRKTFRVKKLYTNNQWESEDSSENLGSYDYTRRGLYPGRSLYILITFRGMTNTGTSNGEYGAGRLAFNCNWKHQVILDGKNQSGFADAKLVADDYL